MHDANNNIYTIGWFAGTVDFDPGPNVVNLSSATNIRNTFITKMDSSGNLIWAKQLSGSANEPNDMDLDEAASRMAREEWLDILDGGIESYTNKQPNASDDDSQQLEHPLWKDVSAPYRS